MCAGLLSFKTRWLTLRNGGASATQNTKNWAEETSTVGVQRDANIIKNREGNAKMAKVLLENERSKERVQICGGRRKPGAQVDVQTPNQTALHPLTPSQE